MYNEKNFKTAHPTTFGLSLLAGSGIVLMIIALGIGVVQAEANTHVIGMMFTAGLLLFMSGVIAWAGSTQPFTHFDDINQPIEDDHGHGHGLTTNDENALVRLGDEAPIVATPPPTGQNH